MINYPSIDPVALQIGPLKIHWYGLMYLIGFLAAWALAHYRVKKLALPWSSEQISDLIFFGALGVVLGGRIGYMLFYNWHQWLKEPLSLFYVWQGGMSFHGGLLGVLLAIIYFAKRNKKNFWDVTDFIAPMVPIGLAAGRLGNFINGELWGRITTKPWGMVFPFAGPQPRHPSQLYELILEGLVLFVILWCYSCKPKPRYTISGLFCMMYGVFRFTVEFFRQPDSPIGFVAFDWLTMGQVLSLPMIILGGALIIYGYKNETLA